jgi:hypothetical protein
MLTTADIKFIEQKGISKEKVASQIDSLTRGFPPVELIRPATVGDGIIKLKESEQQGYVRLYGDNLELKKIKFVPASGAASRMFKTLHEYLNDRDISDNKDAKQVIERISDFAFYPLLLEQCKKKRFSFDELIAKQDYQKIIKMIVQEEGLNYGNMPKGLLQFHRYGETTRTAFEEHLVEGARYAQDGASNVNIHFTVSPEHMDGFKSLQNKVLPEYENEFDVKFNISYSVQKSATDTIAVDMENKPFRLQGGELLFRPGGHGALIDNLNEQDADIVFIKNIDNVVPDRLKSTTVKYKKIIAAILLETQHRLFKLIEELDERSNVERTVGEAVQFIKSRLFKSLPASFDVMPLADKADLIRDWLNRTIRVSGVVKNEGEPGGGPYWVKHSSGEQSLQIVESSQLGGNDEAQQRIFDSATHFNPVDVVCGVRNYRGEKFNLNDYVDYNTGFVSKKSAEGRYLKALELPGLWNGAMAYWNTIFVEVPIETFNPVKSVIDLLRPQHQPQ